MIKAIVTDIEGTTSSLSFVKDVLFPYARLHMAEFVRQHADEAEVKALLQEVCDVVEQQLDLEQVTALLVQWIDEDQKLTPLKALQGMIWQAGYKSVDFTGHVYKDAADKLHDWHEQGIKLYVFSSGSVKAQQLIFTYSNFGDLTPLFSGYFDTRIGPKREVQAYARIAESIALPAAEILFLSDIEQELDAASEAGMHTLQLVRDSGTIYSNHHPSLSNFTAIDVSAIKP